MSVASIVERPITSLRPYARNARTHSKKQIQQIAVSISRFGFTNPVLVSDNGQIIAGHGRVEAAKRLGWSTVPTLALSHLSEAERRAYVLADNKLALNAGWDKEMLAIELQGLIELDFEVELTGFSLAEVDLVLDEASDADPGTPDAPEDVVPTRSGPPVSRHGDLWALGRHRLLCGDTRNAADLNRLMDGRSADLVFTDPPYNVAIDGNVCGLGTVKHREFAFASGEMSKAQFTEFLAGTLSNLSRVMRDGAIAFVCMDWRHMGARLSPWATLRVGRQIGDLWWQFAALLTMVYFSPESTGAVMAEEQQPQPIQAPMFYGSSVQVESAGNDFTLVFSRSRPVVGQLDGKQVAFNEPQVIVTLSPQTIKDLSIVTAGAVKAWEEQFGEIVSAFTKERGAK